MNQNCDSFEPILEEILPSVEGGWGRGCEEKPLTRLTQAMHYAVLGSGKRIRPQLMFMCIDLLETLGYPGPHIDRDGAYRIAAALELAHSYSLVHDDLPCMDNDELRRGRPSTHVAFDEATALLAGNALLTLAFEILCDEKIHPDPEVRCQLMHRFSFALGWQGMMGGQLLDISSEGRFGVETAGNLHKPAGRRAIASMKTGALIECAGTMALLWCGANELTCTEFSRFLVPLGSLFQVTDDLIDATSDQDTAGKPTGKDLERRKAGATSGAGISGAQTIRDHLVDQCRQALDRFGGNAQQIRELCEKVADRSR